MSSVSYSSGPPSNASRGGPVRPSSCIVLIDPLNRVLLVQRSSALTMSFSNAHVFPGGNLDAKQDVLTEGLLPSTPTIPESELLQLRLKLCAIRETFEETGILLVRKKGAQKYIGDLRLAEEYIPKPVLEDARRAICKGELSFTEFLSREKVEIDLSVLHRFTTWITPASNPKRYHTKMYLAFLPTVHPDFPPPIPESSSPPPLPPRPTHPTPSIADPREIISTTFTHPTIPLRLNSLNKITLFPPQFYILNHLALTLPPPTVPLTPQRGADRTKIVSLSHNKFRNMVITSYVIKAGLPDGRVALALDRTGTDEENFIGGQQQQGKKEKRRGDEDNLILVKFAPVPEAQSPLNPALGGGEPTTAAKKPGPPVPQQLALVHRVTFLEELKEVRVKQEKEKAAESVPISVEGSPAPEAKL